MINHVAFEACPDYYPHFFTQETYNESLKKLAERGAGFYPKKDEKGLRLVSRIELVWQYVRGLLGFVNQCAPERVNYETLKFLYHGEVQGFINQENVGLLEKLQAQRGNSQRPVDQAIQEIVKAIRQRHEPDHVESGYEKLQEILRTFGQKYAAHLRPSFWQRLRGLELADRTLLTNFGDAHLEVSKRLRHEGHDEEALNHLKFALNLKSPSPQFLKKLSNEFAELKMSDDEFLKSLVERGLKGGREADVLNLIEAAPTDGSNKYDLYIDVLETSFAQKKHSVTARCYDAIQRCRSKDEERPSVICFLLYVHGRLIYQKCIDKKRQITREEVNDIIFLHEACERHMQEDFKYKKELLEGLKWLYDRREELQKNQTVCVT